MAKPTDVRLIGTALYFLPVYNRVPLKFGPEVTTYVTCARARVRVRDRLGRVAEGWGETPLSVQWVWPSSLPYQWRHERLKGLCLRLAQAWPEFDFSAHPLELGHEFVTQRLPGLVTEAAEQSAPRDRSGHPPEVGAAPSPPALGPAAEPLPWLGALVCCSVFDQALHDAYGQLLGRPTYSTYTGEFMNADLSRYLEALPGAGPGFAGQYPADYLLASPAPKLRAWHLVGGLDPLTEADLTGAEPKDEYPVLLRDWIARDGLKCLKVKLRGNDAVWDYTRLVQVGTIGVAQGVEWLSADFNCTVSEPAYVNGILDHLRDEHPRLYGMILYVEQPFPYDLERHRIDVRSVSSRKPLFLDESAHDWRLVRLGRELGWSGVALKTCKTQSGALLTACWAKAHGLSLMVQDLTNPMLAQIPHLLLAQHAGTIMGVETNGMQFYPEASRPEAAVHPGAYRRREGMVDLSTVRGPGFGYRLEEIKRDLPAPAAVCGE